MAIDIASGLAWLSSAHSFCCFSLWSNRTLGESYQIVHLDMKLENVLVDEHGICKVHDFGTSMVKIKTKTGRLKEKVITF